MKSYKDITKGVTFSDSIYYKGHASSKHSHDYFGLYLSSWVIGSPQPHTYTVEIPGRDGVLDLTETLYKNRKITITFAVPDVEKNWAGVYAIFAREVHGAKKYVIFDVDPEFAFYGRVTINKFNTAKHKGSISIDIDAEPYKLNVNNPRDNASVVIDGKTVSAWKWDTFNFSTGVIQNTVFDMNVVSGQAQTIINNKMRVKPEFKSSGNADILFNGNGYVLTGDNNWHTPGFYFESGENTITFIGSGVVQVAFRSGDL